MYKQLIDSLSKESQVLLNEPMKNHTSFKIGGPADILIMPGSIDDVKRVINFAKDVPLYSTTAWQDIPVSGYSFISKHYKGCRI